ncbi:MAG TPA: hypothetical protein VN829_11930 [Dongiaceae bacterium]|nr:hypothetical protein [Dongiaceae bacterium]
MSYRTLEVELENGRVRPRGGEPLPPKAHALLTILSPPSSEPDETAGPSIADLAGELVGIGTGTHTDLSSNKAHLDDFGR